MEDLGKRVGKPPCKPGSSPGEPQAAKKRRGPGKKGLSAQVVSMAERLDLLPGAVQQPVQPGSSPSSLGLGMVSPGITGAAGAVLSPLPTSLVMQSVTPQQQLDEAAMTAAFLDAAAQGDAGGWRRLLNLRYHCRRVAPNWCDVERQ